MNSPRSQAPDHGRERVLAPFLEVRRCFSPEECDGIIRIGSDLPLRKGQVTAPEIQPLARNSSVALIPPGPDVQWIYDRIFDVVRKLNGQFWKFEISGSERIQFSRYGAGEYYDWHMDLSARGNFSHRKISVTVQLTDAGDYDGGELEVNIGSASSTASRERGLLAAFPSYALHRVARITRGTRHSLTAWVVGETPFR